MDATVAAESVIGPTRACGVAPRAITAAELDAVLSSVAGTGSSDAHYFRALAAVCVQTVAPTPSAHAREMLCAHADAPQPARGKARSTARKAAPPSLARPPIAHCAGMLYALLRVGRRSSSSSRSVTDGTAASALLETTTHHALRAALPGSLIPQLLFTLASTITTEAGLTSTVTAITAEIVAGNVASDPTDRLACTVLSPRALEEFVVLELMHADPSGVRPFFGSAPTATSLLGAKVETFTVADRVPQFTPEQLHHCYMVSALRAATTLDADARSVADTYCTLLARRVAELLRATDRPISAQSAGDAAGLGFVVALALEADALRGNGECVGLLRAARTPAAPRAPDAVPEFRAFESAFPRAAEGRPLLDTTAQLAISLLLGADAVEAALSDANSLAVGHAAGSSGLLSATMLRLPSRSIARVFGSASAHVFLAAATNPHLSLPMLRHYIQCVLDAENVWALDLLYRIVMFPLIALSVDTAIDGAEPDDPIAALFSAFVSVANPHTLPDAALRVTSGDVLEVATDWAGLLSSVGAFSVRMIAAARCVVPLLTEFTSALQLGQRLHSVPNLVQHAINAAKLCPTTRSMAPAIARQLFDVARCALAVGDDHVVEAACAAVCKELSAPMSFLALSDAFVDLHTRVAGLLLPCLRQMQQSRASAAAALFAALHTQTWEAIPLLQMHSAEEQSAGRLDEDPWFASPTSAWGDDNDPSVAAVPHTPLPSASVAPHGPVAALVEVFVLVMAELATIDHALADRALVCVCNVWRVAATEALRVACLTCIRALRAKSAAPAMRPLRTLLGCVAAA